MARKKATRKSKRSTQRGRGIKEVLKKVHSIIKGNKVISKGLRLAGKPGLAKAADMLGYGRKKRRTRKSTTRKKGTLGSSLMRIARAPKRRTTMRGRGIAIPGARSLTMRGRGFFGKTLGGIGGSLLGGLLPF